MSKCKPTPTPKLESLSQYGIVLEDVTSKSGQKTEREVVIRIPYEALISSPDVQRAFQDLVTISSTE